MRSVNRSTGQNFSAGRRSGAAADPAFSRFRVAGSIDAGDDEDRNLTIAEVRSGRNARAWRSIGVRRAGQNHELDGSSRRNREIQRGDALPLESQIDRLSSGEATSVRFNFTFAGGDDDETSAPRRDK